jgi:hypothetical protein
LIFICRIGIIVLGRSADISLNQCRDLFDFARLGLLAFLPLTTFFTFAARTTLLALASAYWCFLTRGGFGATLVARATLWTLAAIFFRALAVAIASTPVIALPASVTAAFSGLLGGFDGGWGFDRFGGIAEP